MRYGVFILAAAVIAAPLAGAYADITVVSETTGAVGVVTPSTMYLTVDRIKVDMPKTALILEIGPGKMVYVRKEEKKYTEEDIKALGARMSDAVATMKQKLESAPEAQRKMMEAVIAQLSAQKAVTSYEKIGQSKSIGAWPCEMFHLKKDGKLLADMCIAKADEVGLTADDLTALRNLAAMTIKSLPPAVVRDVAVADFDEQTSQIGFAGITVESTMYFNRGPNATTTVKSIDHSPIAPDTFFIPADYAKETTPGQTIGQ